MTSSTSHASPAGRGDGPARGRTTDDAITFRAPGIGDGLRLWELVRDSGSLDLNSPYAYLLLARDFADTCVIAESPVGLAGFVTAYVPPARPDVVFVWQIAVHSSARKRGLGRRLLHSLLRSPACAGVRYLECTVTPSNRPSSRLFESLARDLSVPCERGRGFPRECFPGRDHEEEELYRIGPIKQTRTHQENP